MKKLLVVVVLLLLCVSAVSLAEDPIIGKWYLTEIIQDGQNYQAPDIGIEMTIEVKSDNTFTFTIGSIENTGKWQQSGNTYTLGKKEAVLEGGTLSMDSGSMHMIFTRTAGEPTVLQPLHADSEDEFIGSWVLDRVGTNGVVVPVGNTPGEKTFDVSMIVSPGSATVYFDIKDVDRTTLNYQTSYEDGKLVLSSDAYDALGITITPLEKTDEGIMTTLSMPSEDSGEPVTLYLKKDETAAPSLGTDETQDPAGQE